MTDRSGLKRGVPGLTGTTGWQEITIFSWLVPVLYRAELCMHNSPCIQLAPVQTPIESMVSMMGPQIVVSHSIQRQ